MADGYKGTAHYRKAHEDWFKAQVALRAERERRQLGSLKHDAAMKKKYRKAGEKYK